MNDYFNTVIHLNTINKGWCEATYLTRTKHTDNKNIEKAVESSVKFIRNKTFECQGIIKIKLEIPGRCFFKTVKFPLLQTMADENLINRPISGPVSREISGLFNHCTLEQ